MSENLGNIEYHKGWVLERNPEPDKLHNKFAWAEKHGVSISIGPNDIGESTQKSEKGRLSEMFDDDFDQDSSIETIHDVRELFKNELFHNSDAYSKAMKKAMSICITRLREAEKPDYTGLTSLIEYLENFITKMSTLNESEETDKVKAAIEQEAMEARKAAKTSISRGINGGSPRLEFDKVEILLAKAIKLLKSALSIAKNTSDARSGDYTVILKPIHSAVVAAFQELQQMVEETYRTSSLKIYHSFGADLLVKPEELTLEYYAKNFLDKIPA
jgi:hypothetical protein